MLGAVTILGTAAVLLQTVGLVVTAVGLRVTWQEFHEPGERFRDPFVRVARRLIPRRRGARVVTVGTAELVLTGMEANVRVEFGPLPEGDRAAIDMLAERLQGLRRNLETTTTDIRADVRQVGQRVDGLRGHMASEVDRLDRADRHVATDGLRLESVGLVIIAIGTLVQVVDGLIR
jgi:hypothetical protein